MRAIAITLGLIALPISAWGQSRTNEMVIEPSAKQLKKLQALTPESVAAQVVVNDDDLETIATLTTAAAYPSRGGFTDRVRSDNFLRAFIHKKTGDARFQLYQTITYGPEYRNFKSVNFAINSEVQMAPVEELSHRVDCQFGPCSMFDDLGFDLTVQQLKEVAATYVPGNSPLWRFKFRAQNGLDWEDRMAPAEVAGLMLAVEHYKAKQATPTR